MGQRDVTPFVYRTAMSAPGLSGAEIETIGVAGVTGFSALSAGLGSVVVKGRFDRRTTEREARRSAYVHFIGASEALGQRAMTYGARLSVYGALSDSLTDAMPLLTALSVMWVARKLDWNAVRELVRLVPSARPDPEPIGAPAMLDAQIELIHSLETLRLVGSKTAIDHGERVFTATDAFVQYARRHVWNAKRPASSTSREFIRLRKTMQKAHDDFVRLVQPELVSRRRKKNIGTYARSLTSRSD